jgi:hypothetical protein
MPGKNAPIAGVFVFMAQGSIARCITCGAELHPERAAKYSYCMSRECQEKNAKGLTMVALGMNKAAEEFLILDETTREELASGKYRDQLRGSFGTSSAAAASTAAPAARGSGTGGAGSRPPAAGGREQRGQRRQPPRRPARAPVPPWTPRQERLALLYNEQGLRPAEIAQKLGVSRYLATQIILAARNRGKV